MLFSELHFSDTTFNRTRRFLSDARIDSIKRGHIHSNLLRDIITVPGPGSYGVPDRHVCDPREGIEMFRSGKLRLSGYQ